MGIKGRIKRTPSILNKMFAIAIFIAGFKFNRLIIVVSKVLNGLIVREKKITVPILKKRLKCASFLESF